MLRQLGCDLPIEFWHLGPEEMPAEWVEAVAPFNVRCVDGREFRKQHPARILNGWELKCYAILHSAFQEVLLLDADNVVVVNPEFLFETPEYKEHGAIFWPDIGHMSPHRDIWKITQVPFRDEPEFESGQIVVDKARCWQALNLAMHYNEHSDFYYQHVYGDKETFHFAFRRVGKDYAMPKRGIHFIDGTLCQHDFEGRRIFQHRLKKWSLHGENSRTEDFWFEEDCLRYLAELRALLGDGGTRPRGLLIPKVLHQIALRGAGELTLAQQRYAASWRKHHPDWEYKLWTEENLPELLNPAQFAVASDPQQKTQILSYEILHRFGGVFIDRDFECRRNIGTLLTGLEYFMSDRAPGLLCLGIIGCTPHHEAMKQLVRRLPESLRTGVDEPLVEQSGENYATRALEHCDGLTFFPVSHFHQPANPEAYAIHHGCSADATSVRLHRRATRFLRPQKSAAERAVADELTGARYIYRRVGHDRRVIEFLTDGTIGEGAAACERVWDLEEQDGRIVLTIFSRTFATCDLRRIAPHRWGGAWAICEKMPVELFPATGEVSLVEPPECRAGDRGGGSDGTF